MEEFIVCYRRMHLQTTELLFVNVKLGARAISDMKIREHASNNLWKAQSVRYFETSLGFLGKHMGCPSFGVNHSLFEGPIGLYSADMRSPFRRPRSPYKHKKTSFVSISSVVFQETSSTTIKNVLLRKLRKA